MSEHVTACLWVHDADEATLESTEIRCIRFEVPGGNNYWMIQVNAGRSRLNIVCHKHELAIKFMEKFNITKEEPYTCRN